MADVDVSDAALRQALEFAVSITSLWARQHEPVPPSMRPFLRANRLNPAQLRKVRAVLEGDAALRERVGAAAGGGAVDEVGLLWLTRPEGWHELVAERSRTTASGDDNAGDDVRSERRRRIAAEEARDRAERERDEAVRSLEVVRRTGDLAAAEAAKVRGELAALQRRHDELQSTARRRASGAQQGSERIAELEAELSSTQAALAEATEARDRALVDRVHESEATAELERVRALLREALSPAAVPSAKVARVERAPLATPHRLHGDPAAEGEYFFRHDGVLVVIDGYNVALLQSKGEPIGVLRDRLLDGVENLVKRWGTNIRIVFDGAHVPGASTRRRQVAFVEFSPQDVKADDVIVSRVMESDSSRPVVVVTDDKQLLSRVRRLGANTIASATLLTLLRR